MIALPNGPIEVVFSLDTTGSMSRILDEIQARLKDMITRLQADIPGIKFAIVAHGDYCDAEHFYVTKHVDFTEDLPTLCDFMNNVGGTGGGDVSECYELVLRMVRENLSWTPTSQKVLIMIGDAYPHEPDYPLNTLKIDWKEEVQIYSQSGVHIYGVHVFEDMESEKFFKTLSEQTFGEYIKMADFSHVCDVIMAICYRERGAEFLEGYEREVRSRFGVKTLDQGLEGVFGALKRIDSRTSNCSIPTTMPSCITPLSRMDTMDVTDTDDACPTPDTATRRISSKPSSTSVKSILSNRLRARTALKTVKRKRDVKTVKKSPVTSHGPRRLRRDKVTVNNFQYSHLNWSQWKLAVTSSPETASKQWMKYNGYFVRKTLFRQTTSARKFQEVSVQTKPGGKRHVVYFDLLNEGQGNMDWFFKLFHTTELQNYIDNVLNDNCRIFVRKAHLPRGRKTISALKKNIEDFYDYAWSETSSRDLSVNGVCIS